MSKTKTPIKILLQTLIEIEELVLINSDIRLINLSRKLLRTLHQDGALNKIVIFVENEIGEPSSNPEQTVYVSLVENVWIYLFSSQLWKSKWADCVFYPLLGNRLKIDFMSYTAREGRFGSKDTYIFSTLTFNWVAELISIKFP